MLEFEFAREVAHGQSKESDLHGKCCASLKLLEPSGLANRLNANRLDDGGCQLCRKCLAMLANSQCRTLVKPQLGIMEYNIKIFPLVQPGTLT
ncbi:hypothetical protein XELAEV_18024456mg [Xenopus laevis]|uniref:Uncharacterized protein n=1 Tax=Xenopus laevis TaxID=8355 RepID=A0A974HLC5_XENLA|nr:hypothetical protein XELAEV_18024456mg [Xenopus laevis]